MQRVFDFLSKSEEIVTASPPRPSKSEEGVGERPSATRETRNFCLSLSFLVLSASKVMNKVMILVSEAG